MNLKELFQASPLGVVGIICLGGVFAALFGMSAVYATEQGFSLARVSYFVMSIYLGGMLCQYPIGWLSDRMDRRLLIIAVCLLCALVCTVPFFIESSYRVLLAVSFVIGGTANPLYSLLIAYTNDYLEREQMPAASGGLLFVSGCGAMGGPIAVGYVMQQFGPNGFFVFIGTLMLSVSLYGFWRMFQRSSTEDVIEATPFVAMSSRTSMVATDVVAELALDEWAENDELDKAQNNKPQDSSGAEV